MTKLSKKNTDTRENKMLQAHFRDFMEESQVERICSRINKGAGRPTRNPGRGSEKKKTCVVRLHHSPQKTGQNDAAGNSKEQQRARATGEVLGFVLFVCLVGFLTFRQ